MRSASSRQSAPSSRPSATPRNDAAAFGVAPGSRRPARGSSRAPRAGARTARRPARSAVRASGRSSDRGPRRCGPRRDTHRCTAAHRRGLPPDRCAPRVVPTRFASGVAAATSISPSSHPRARSGLCASARRPRPHAPAQLPRSAAASPRRPSPDDIDGSTSRPVPRPPERRRPELARDAGEQRAARIAEGGTSRPRAAPRCAGSTTRTLLDGRDGEAVRRRSRASRARSARARADRSTSSAARSCRSRALLASPAREAARRAAALAVAVLHEARSGSPVDQSLVLVDRCRVAPEAHPQESAAPRQAEVLGERLRRAGLERPSRASRKGGSTSTVSGRVAKRTRPDASRSPSPFIAIEPCAEREHGAARCALHVEGRLRHGLEASHGPSTHTAADPLRLARPTACALGRASFHDHLRTPHPGLRDCPRGAVRGRRSRVGPATAGRRPARRRPRRPARSLSPTRASCHA